jgi:hypothetical protein
MTIANVVDLNILNQALAQKTSLTIGLGSQSPSTPEDPADVSGPCSYRIDLWQTDIDFVDTRPESKTKIPAEPATISVAGRDFMSVNVQGSCNAVKTKVVCCATLALGAVLSAVQAGPQMGVFARANAVWCAPVRSFCPPLCASPVAISCAWPTFYYPGCYGYAPSAVVASTSLSNVSPVFDDGTMGIYRVPAPVISAPVTIPAGSTFGWRR